MLERSISFGVDNSLVGTLCMPDMADGTDPRATAGIILFNAGIVHRIGPHRINVTLARSLARQGIPSIRFDLSGLGDSPRARSGASFEAQAVVDIRAAMSALCDATGLQRFGLFGFCSGAFHSYNTAHVDERVAALLLFDAYRYPTLRSHLNRLSLRFRRDGIAKTIFRLALKTLSNPLRSLFPGRSSEGRQRVAEVGFIVDSTTKASFAEGVRHLLDRGVDVSKIYAGDGLEVYNYTQQFRDAFKRYGIADRVTTTFLPDIDHVATGKAAQRELIGHLQAWSARVAGIPLRSVAAEPPAAQPLQGISLHVESVRRQQVIPRSPANTGLDPAG